MLGEAQLRLYRLVVTSLGRSVASSADGSSDGSWRVMTDLAAQDSRVVALRHRRNFGKARGLATAAPRIHDLWSQTSTRVGGDIGLDMITSSITQAREEIVVTRGGTTDLRYAPYRTRGRADDVVYNPDGSIKSPIDEFNTEVGAALCGADVPVPSILANAAPGTRFFNHPTINVGKFFVAG